MYDMFHNPHFLLLKCEMNALSALGVHST